MVTSERGRPFIPPGLCTFFGSCVEFRLLKFFNFAFSLFISASPRKRFASREGEGEYPPEKGRFVRDEREGGERGKNY